ncbi:hypothetical protein ACU686_39680 [Yinghuangia aomiensis]
MVGSVGFLSPEQLQAERITPAADVFALGAVPRAALRGIAPFGEGSAAARCCTGPGRTRSRASGRAAGRAAVTW